LFFCFTVTNQSLSLSLSSARPSAFGDIRGPSLAPILGQQDARTVWEEGDPDVRVSVDQKDRMQTDARELATGGEPMDLGM
jgi:hypothetical protein